MPGSGAKGGENVATHLRPLKPHRAARRFKPYEAEDFFKPRMEKGTERKGKGKNDEARITPVLRVGENVAGSSRGPGKRIHNLDRKIEGSGGKKRSHGEDVGGSGKKRRKEDRFTPFRDKSKFPPMVLDNFYPKSTSRHPFAPKDKSINTKSSSSSSSLANGKPKLAQVAVLPELTVSDKVSKRDKDARRKRREEKHKELELLKKKVGELETQVERNKLESTVKDKVCQGLLS
jgi:hypothetical protein